MKENKFHHREIKPEAQDKSLSKNNSARNPDVRADSGSYPHLNENNKLTRRYSFDDNGGGYRGL